ncbi:MAG: hypothetical protein WCF99_11870, partial [Chloroflexales bacterium]
GVIGGSLSAKIFTTVVLGTWNFLSIPASHVMLSAAKHLSRFPGRPFASLRVTWVLDLSHRVTSARVHAYHARVHAYHARVHAYHAGVHAYHAAGVHAYHAEDSGNFTVMYNGQVIAIVGNVKFGWETLRDHKQKIGG